MKTALHLAISADGFIAKADGDSDWVSPIDGDLFISRAKAAGCLVVGKKTFDQYHGSLYPIVGVLNIVLTHDTVAEQADTDVVFARSPAEAIEIAERNGYSNLLVAGGAKTSRAFLDAGLVNEIFLSVHPLRLGAGMKPFEDLSKDTRYKLARTKELGGGLIEEQYVMV